MAVSDCCTHGRCRLGPHCPDIGSTLYVPLKYVIKNISVLGAINDTC